MARHVGDWRNLKLRAASALVLAPVVLVVTYSGGWLFLILCAAAAGGILWEWEHLVVGNSDTRILLPGLVALIAALLFVGFGRPGAATAAIVVGGLFAGGIAGVGGRHGGEEPRLAAAWAAAGVVYAGLAFIGPAVLRGDPLWGLTAVLFVLITVWATDIFAFLVGKSAGGALLWPRLSPNKTWAGAAGGLVGGVAGGLAVAYASGVGKLGMAGIMALLLAVSAQGGDLFESAVKRRFGAKDASRLIPGHGGLMDRLDGFLVAALVGLIIGILRQGTDAAGRGLLLW